MRITVRKYKQSDLKAWDNFVNTSSNGTIFHLRSFLSYHIEGIKKVNSMGMVRSIINEEKDEYNFNT